MKALVTVTVLLMVCAASAQDRTTTLRIEGRANAFPWIAAERSFVAVAWGVPVPEGGADVFVAVSRDAGQSFGSPVRVNTVSGTARLGGELPPRVALTRTDAGDPSIVVVWGAKAGTTDIRVSRSVDGGRTFSESTVLNAKGSAGDRGWHAAVVDSSGIVHAMWLDHRGLAGRPKGEHDHHAGLDMSQFSGLYYAAVSTGASGASRARGAASAAPLAPLAPVLALAERELVKGVCYCCKTSLVTGLDGTLYAAWRHVYPGNIRDIAFTSSRDGGKTFAPPSRVSSDQWQLAGCPDDGPAMAAGQDGGVHVVWPTVVTTEETTRGALFYASTHDGQTFTSRLEIPTLGAPKPSHPMIASDEAGGFVVAWDEVQGGVRRAFTRRLRFNSAGYPTFGEAAELDKDGSSAYPVLTATTRGVFVAWTHGTGASSEIRVRRLE